MVLVDSINVEEKDVTYSSSRILIMVQQAIRIDPVLMIWDDVPFNKFIITVKTSQYSSSGRQLLNKEEELQHKNSVFENLKI